MTRFANNRSLRRQKECGGRLACRLPASLRRLAGLTGKLWTLPNTVAGLAFGCIGYAAGSLAYGFGAVAARPRCSIGNNALQFHHHPLMLPRTAVAIGNTISYGRGSDPEKYGAYGDRDAQIGLHEKAHTLQYQVLGPFFFPLYMMLGGFSGPAGNPLERAAQDYAKGKPDWWPRSMRKSS